MISHNDDRAEGVRGNSWLRPELHNLPVYLPGTGAPAGYVGPWYKLSSNESPYEPSDAVVAAVEHAARAANLYPPIFGAELAELLALSHGIDASRVAVAGGSLVLLQQAVQAAASPGDEVVFAWRSYEAYPIIVQTARCRPVAVPLRSHRVDLPALADRITEATRLVVICSPNNPTGTDTSGAQLEAFLEATRGRCLVVLDEAYREFSTDAQAPDGLELQQRFDHVLTLRTFSKAYSLAGARVGWCAGNPEIVAALTRVALPFTLSRLAAAAAAAALEAEPGESAQHVAEVTSERERLSKALGQLGFEVPTSQANFLWLPLGERSRVFAEACAGFGVSVRCFSGEGVRVTIGSPVANDRVVEAATHFASGSVVQGD